MKDLFARSQSLAKLEELAGLLATGTWTHDYPITFEEAQQLGLNVSSDLPPAVLQLMSLFPQPVRRQPSVEFLPGPPAGESRPSRRMCLSSEHPFSTGDACPSRSGGSELRAGHIGRRGEAADDDN